jgi:hypothetical protein
MMHGRNNIKLCSSLLSFLSLPSWLYSSNQALYSKTSNVCRLHNTTAHPLPPVFTIVPNFTPNSKQADKELWCEFKLYLGYLFISSNTYGEFNLLYPIS